MVSVQMDLVAYMIMVRWAGEDTSVKVTEEP